jgi:hypothetical protein
MNLLLGILIVVAVTAVAITAMLLVRRRAPEGSYFTDGDRASGVFGVMATGFSVMLGFIIFLAFSSYDAARAGAAAEATIVAQQVETAQFFAGDARDDLTEQLVCYGRSVAGEEWDRLEDGSLGETINPWAAAMFGTIREVEPGSDTEQSAYDRWMDQTGAREQARNDRVHGVGGVVPTPLWVVLYLIAAVIFVYMLFFADSGESAVTQGMLMGGVSVVVTSLLLLLVFLDRPFGEGVGALRPDAMERTLRLVDQELEIAGLDVAPPCGADGGES